MKLNTTKTYSLAVGSILFILGFLGFAFRTTAEIPIYYLLGCLVFGFWGIVVGASSR